ncbi:hypothetical protein RHSIM_Rhsim07G0192300 [Rhododendron simsii]|uniref:Uncharacterized protein n=1 Tax=Rhododendron simsii TaxID=118357 RepID=A0A834GTZ3_RHOSS|nr:hypothetical protein RHSIM_Rhsim07G0192300 [Rhododendron simsii]
MPELPKTQIIDTNVPSGVPFYSGSSGVSSSHAQMFQPVNGPGLFYPQTFPKSHRSYNSDGGFNRNRGGRGFGFGLGNSQRPECQICGRDNHTALYCYYRQNLQYQPPPNVQFQSSSTPFMFGRSGSSPWFGNQRGYSAFPQQNYAAPPQSTAMRHNGYNVFNGQFGASHGQFGASTGQFGGSNGPYNGQSSSQFPRTAVSSPFTPSVANMIAVIKTKSVEYMSFSLSFFLLLNSGCWFTVALILKDFYVIVPNAIGIATNSSQILLYMIYKNKSPLSNLIGSIQATDQEAIDMQSTNVAKTENPSLKGNHNPKSSSRPTSLLLMRTLSQSPHETHHNFPTEQDEEDCTSVVVDHP